MPQMMTFDSMPQLVVRRAQPGEHRLDDARQLEPAPRVEHRRVAHLHVADVLARGVLGELVGDAVERLLGLHHAQRDVERLQVLDERAAVLAEVHRACGARPGRRAGARRAARWRARGSSARRSEPSRWTCRSVLGSFSKSSSGSLRSESAMSESSIAREAAARREPVQRDAWRAARHAARGRRRASAAAKGRAERRAVGRRVPFPRPPAAKASRSASMGCSPTSTLIADPNGGQAARDPRSRTSRDLVVDPGVGGRARRRSAGSRPRQRRGLPRASRSPAGVSPAAPEESVRHLVAPCLARRRSSTRARLAATAEWDGRGMLSARSATRSPVVVQDLGHRGWSLRQNGHWKSANSTTLILPGTQRPRSRAARAAPAGHSAQTKREHDERTPAAGQSQTGARRCRESSVGGLLVRRRSAALVGRDQRTPRRRDDRCTVDDRRTACRRR